MLARLLVVGISLTLATAGQQYPFVAITGAGAPNGASFLFEDHQGGLWLADAERRRESLIYFDGTRFVSPLSVPFHELVNGMAEGDDGAIWMASDTGLFRLSQGRLEKIVDGVKFWEVKKIAPEVFLAIITNPDRSDSSDMKLVRVSWAGGKWQIQTMPESTTSLILQMDRSGNILYACDGGYCEFSRAAALAWNPGRALKIEHHAMLQRFGLVPVRAVFRDRGGCIWMRSGSGSTAYQCPGDVSSTLLPTSIAGRGNCSLSELEDGSMVIPGFGELAIGRPGRFRLLRAANGYPATGWSLVGRDGTIWLSNANGLFALSTHLQMEFWTEHEGLVGNPWSILPFGGRVFALAGDSIEVLAADSSRWLPLAELRDGNHLAPGPDGTLLASSRSSGVVQMTVGGTILRRSAPADAAMLAQTPDGRSWIAANDISQVEFNGKQLTLLPENAPPPPEGWRDLKVDPEGELWACGGLAYKGESGWHAISSTVNLLRNDCLSFTIDQKGDIWYGYAGGEPSFSLIETPKSAKPRIRNFASGGEVGNAGSNFFGSDRRGNLWRGATTGIYVADREQARQGQWLWLNRSDGLPGVDANQRSFVEDRDGSVWFGIDNSVIHLSPSAELVHPTYSPKVFVSGFSWNNGTFQMARLVDQIQHGASLVAHIGSLQFDRRNALRLRYRLLPEEPMWRPAANLDIALGKLPWGRHDLEVQGRIGAGPWSSTAVKSFTVLKPIWFSWPFLIVFAGTGGLAGIAGQRWRKRRRRRAKTTLPSLAEWRLAVLSPEVQRLEGALLDGRFEVRRILARGGFATVYEGRDLEHESQICAVKIFRHELLDKSWISRRYQQEISALKQVSHPNVVRIYGHGTLPSGAPYLAMEFIQGKTLRELLKERRIERQQTGSYLRQSASALDEIHSHAVCHRDFKPENLMIRNVAAEGRELVLIDFSIAIVQDPDETLHGLSRAAGTIYYMAPEQAIGYADPSSDIYSLAKVLMEMLTGQRLSSLLPDASMDLPARVREFLTAENFGLSPASIDLIASALEFDPSRRPKNAGEFAFSIARDLDTSRNVASNSCVGDRFPNV